VNVKIINSLSELHSVRDGEVLVMRVQEEMAIISVGILTQGGPFP
jgi:hypothetical protein